MSVKLMAQVWELDLDRSRQTIMLALADHAHDDGTKCYPGVGYLAWKTGYQARQVQRILRRLEADGLAEPIGWRFGGRGWAVEYNLHLEKGVKKSPFIAVDKLGIKRGKGDKKTPFAKEERVTFETQRVTCEVQKGDIAMSPEPYPLSEPEEEEGESNNLPIIENPKLKIQNGKDGLSEQDAWLAEFLRGPAAAFVPYGMLANATWWETVSVACGGLNELFVSREFAKMQAHLIEYPEKRPQTAKGWKRLVRSWLCRADAWERERMAKAVQRGSS